MAISAASRKFGCILTRDSGWNILSISLYILQSINYWKFWLASWDWFLIFCYGLLVFFFFLCFPQMLQIFTSVCSIEFLEKAINLLTSCCSMSPSQKPLCCQFWSKSVWLPERRQAASPEMVCLECRYSSETKPQPCSTRLYGDLVPSYHFLCLNLTGTK